MTKLEQRLVNNWATVIMGQVATLEDVPHRVIVMNDGTETTLKAQVEKQLAAGENVIFDVDVIGGCNIKKFYGDRALSVFIQPPSMEELRKRLEGRGTDEPAVIENRLAKAEFELGFANKFDVVIINDVIEEARAKALKVIKEFLDK